jgi:hypothetical protein
MERKDLKAQQDSQEQHRQLRAQLEKLVKEALYVQQTEL